MAKKKRERKRIDVDIWRGAYDDREGFTAFCGEHADSLLFNGLYDRVLAGEGGGFANFLYGGTGGRSEYVSFVRTSRTSAVGTRVSGMAPQQHHKLTAALDELFEGNLDAGDGEIRATVFDTLGVPESARRLQ